MRWLVALTAALACGCGPSAEEIAKATVQAQKAAREADEKRVEAAMAIEVGIPILRELDKRLAEAKGRMAVAEETENAELAAVYRELVEETLANREAVVTGLKQKYADVERSFDYETPHFDLPIDCLPADQALLWLLEKDSNDLTARIRGDIVSTPQLKLSKVRSGDCGRISACTVLAVDSESKYVRVGNDDFDTLQLIGVDGKDLVRGQKTTFYDYVFLIQRATGKEPGLSEGDLYGHAIHIDDLDRAANHYRKAKGKSTERPPRDAPGGTG